MQFYKIVQGGDVCLYKEYEFHPSVWAVRGLKKDIAIQRLECCDLITDGVQQQTQDEVPSDCPRTLSKTCKIQQRT